MEMSMSGNALKTFVRSITCLARIGNELAIQASPSLLTFHTLNASRSAYQSITFKPDFFDVYTVSGSQVRCSILLKAICSVLRTPISNVDVLNVVMPNSEASKVQWTLNCFNGMKKTYWVTCNVEPDIQHLSLDRRKLPSNFVVRPRDLSRLLGNFQTTLQEITIIATRPCALPPDAAAEIEGKAVELRSYVDPTKENDSSLHTQLWIDPTEEFVQYSHAGEPIDITFGMKELKAFLTFCEACEVDIHFYFEKAGEPILMAPKSGLDDGSTSNFDSTVVLATMLASQLHKGSSMEDQPGRYPGAQAQERSKGNMSEHASDHTRIWSELSVRSNNGTETRQVPRDKNTSNNVQREVHGIDALHISNNELLRDVPGAQKEQPPRSRSEGNHITESQGMKATNNPQVSQHHPSNWVDADECDEEGDESDLYVQPTPPCYDD